MLLFRQKYGKRTSFPQNGSNLDITALAGYDLSGKVYHSATEAEQKEFMKAFIERIEMFPEKRKDGSWIKKIVFNFPVPVDGEEVKELPLETEATVETVVLLERDAASDGDENGNA